MNDVEMQVAIARLTQVVESGFRAVDERFETQQEQSRHQHAENVARMDRIEGHAERTEVEVRKTNGRVTRLEEQVRTLFNAIERKVSAVTTDIGDRTGITRRDVAVFIAGAGGPIVAYKFAEWVFHVLRLP